MQTPVLTKKQQKTSLSAKKQKKITIKNVLATPYAEYWPALKPEDNTALLETLEKYLPKVKNEKFCVPWKELKNIPKNERKKFREEYVQKNSTTSFTPDNEGSEMMFGVNEVTKCLENKTISAVMVSSDIQPRFMVKHVVDLAVLHNVPILVVDDLRKILKNVCGISSITVGLKHNIKPDTKLSLVYQNIKRISESYPVPHNHINYSRGLQPLENISGVENQMDEKKSKTYEPIENIRKADEIESKPLNILQKRSKANRKDVENEEDIVKTIYLMKKTNNEMAFTPKRSQSDHQPKKDQMDVDESGFLSFGDETSKKSAKSDLSLKNVSYKSLIVKRLKGDPNRNKRKIENLKKKKKK